MTSLDLQNAFLMHGLIVTDCFTINPDCSQWLLVSNIWAIPAETTILPSKHDTGPRHILFLQILYFFYMIMDRCIYLNKGHFVTKLNNGFLISGRTFYPQKFITVTMEKCHC